MSKIQCPTRLEILIDVTYFTAASGSLCPLSPSGKGVSSTAMMPLVRSDPCSGSGGVKGIGQISA